MPRTKEKKGRKANGSGTYRMKTVIRNGKEYTYWETRYTEGIDPGTGKQIQRSITGKTQKEVVQKLKAATAAIDAGTYTAPSKMTVGQWLDIWVAEYLTDVKPRTADSYRATVDTHLKAALGAVKLDALATHEIQQFYNSLQKEQGDRQPLSPKTIRNIHGVFHKAIQQAVELGYIRNNPATACKLPRVERAEIKPLDSDAIPKFLDAIKGDPYELVYVVTLFTGMREGEVLGLTWNCVDFDRGTITISKQLQKERRGTGAYHLVSPKNGKSRRITPAKTVMEVLRQQRQQQTDWKRFAGESWEKSDFVFTDPLGHHFSAQTVYLHFKKLAAKAGYPDARFHDLRHPNVKPRTQTFSSFFEIFHGHTLRSYLGHFLIVQVSYGA